MWSELGFDAWLTLAVLLAALVMLVREMASPDLILLGGLAVLLVAGVFESPSDALVGFSSKAVLTIGSLFVVASAARKTGAFRFAFDWMRPRSGRLAAFLARVMLPVSGLSAFVNNTPLVAILVPTIQEWGRKVKIPPSKVLMPLSYAAILGGMSTLIGTSTNLAVSAALEQRGSEPLSMFELAWIGVPASILGYVYFATIGHRLLPVRSDPTTIAHGDVRSYQFELRVSVGSSLAGRSVERAGLRHLEGAFLSHVIRGREMIAPVRPDLVLEPSDLLAFSGSTEIMDRLLAGGGLERVVEPVDLENGNGAPPSPDLPLFEVVVAAESSLVGKSLQQVGFREQFQAVVLGIHRRGAKVEGPLGRSAIHRGDVLLIESADDFAARWQGSDEFYFVASHGRKEGPTSERAPWVFAVFAAMVLTVSLGWLPVVSAALCAAILVVFVAGMSPTEARQSIDLSILLVIAAAFGIGEAIQASKLDQALGQELVAWVSGMGALGVLAGIYLLTNLLTEILTNNVAAVIVFPIGLAAASGIAELGDDPRSVAVVVAVAASASFASPVGYQTNLMVMGPGGYRFTDYLRVGLPLNLLIMALTLTVVSWIWLA